MLRVMALAVLMAVIGLSPKAEAHSEALAGRFFRAAAGSKVRNYRNRSFDPATGRFLQRDPVLGGDPLYNPYCFPGNNPVTNVDPMGTEDFDASGDTAYWIVEEEGNLWDRNVDKIPVGKVKDGKVVLDAEFGGGTISIAAATDIAQGHAYMNNLPDRVRQDRIKMAFAGYSVLRGTGMGESALGGAAEGVQIGSTVIVHRVSWGTLAKEDYEYCKQMYSTEAGRADIGAIPAQFGTTVLGALLLFEGAVALAPAAGLGGAGAGAAVTAGATAGGTVTTVGAAAATAGPVIVTQAPRGMPAIQSGVQRFGSQAGQLGVRAWQATGGRLGQWLGKLGGGGGEAQGGFQLSQHALQRMVERGISPAEVQRAMQSAPFKYFHEGQWKLGYYDAATRVFIGRVGDIATTVIRVTPRYIENLKKLAPPSTGG